MTKLDLIILFFDNINFDSSTISQHTKDGITNAIERLNNFEEQLSNRSFSQFISEGVIK